MESRLRASNCICRPARLQLSKFSVHHRKRHAADLKKRSKIIICPAKCLVFTIFEVRGGMPASFCNIARNAAQCLPNKTQMVRIYGDGVAAFWAEQQFAGGHFEGSTPNGPHIGREGILGPHYDFQGTIFACLNFRREMLRLTINNLELFLRYIQIFTSQQAFPKSPIFISIFGLSQIGPFKFGTDESRPKVSVSFSEGYDFVFLGTYSIFAWSSSSSASSIMSANINFHSVDVTAEKKL